jgi:putative ABC transport system permease protein
MSGPLAKDAGRDGRGFGWLDALALDCRLGVRLLGRHKGLTVAGGLAIAVAIAIGATFVEVVGEAVSPALPFPDGDRIVAVVHGGPASGTDDFVSWRGRLASLEQISAFHTEAHNLVLDRALPEPIQVAEITASAFVLARVPPLAGRYLLPGDERPEAPPVVVIGHQAWQSRFAGDPGIVGRAVKLGGVQRTVVGIMPDGFRFPPADPGAALRRVAGAVRARRGGRARARVARTRPHHVLLGRPGLRPRP